MSDPTTQDLRTTIERELIERLLSELEKEAYAHWSIDPSEDPLIAEARAYLAQPS